MKSKGATISDKLSTIFFTPESRGIMANAPIAYGEELMFIPHDLMITIDQVQNSGKCKEMKEKNL